MEKVIEVKQEVLEQTLEEESDEEEEKSKILSTANQSVLGTVAFITEEEADRIYKTLQQDLAQQNQTQM